MKGVNTAEDTAKRPPSSPSVPQYSSTLRHLSRSSSKEGMLPTTSAGTYAVSAPRPKRKSQKSFQIHQKTIASICVACSCYAFLLIAGMALGAHFRTIVLVVQKGALFQESKTIPTPIYVQRVQLTRAEEEEVRPLEIEPVPLAIRAYGVQDFVQEADLVYDKEKSHLEFDVSPIVIEKYKLVFFTIPKVFTKAWKQLFRRMEGLEDWKSNLGGYNGIPHNPDSNGLKYLFSYNLSYASHIMTSSSYTRAIMVRDPKLRFLAAFLDNTLNKTKSYLLDHCCQFSPRGMNKCIRSSRRNLAGFLKTIKNECNQTYMRSQNDRMEHKYWPYMDWVGHIETAEQDAKSLLTKIGAWEEHGMSGWGRSGNESFLVTSQKKRQYHETKSQIKQWYNPAVERKVESFYRGDYENPLFRFKSGKCWTCTFQNDTLLPE